ncbi:unnamed protein product (mitochondrion) [Plasmodiophora brassicae]|uniref:Uncharacterized protein n=1 Tax=Plasmodiophora brassicae TaxID=37360 RepID=A0A3P3YP07_PLABS|nr:unnamed protein product [Plasmodiophora brassicae]
MVGAQRRGLVAMLLNCPYSAGSHICTGFPAVRATLSRAIVTVTIRAAEKAAALLSGVTTMRVVPAATPFILAILTSLALMTGVFIGHHVQPGQPHHPRRSSSQLCSVADVISQRAREQRDAIANEKPFLLIVLRSSREMGHIAAQLPAADAEWDPLRGRIRILVDARDDDGALRKSFKGNDAIRFADGRGSVLETLTGDSAHFLMLMEPGSRLCPGAIPHILHVVVKANRAAGDWSCILTGSGNDGVILHGFDGQPLADFIDDGGDLFGWMGEQKKNRGRVHWTYRIAEKFAFTSECRTSDTWPCLDGDQRETFWRPAHYQE